MAPPPFAQIAATYLENWPAALQSLSVPQVAVPLTADQRDALLAGPIADDPATENSLALLHEKLAPHLAGRADGAFLRLGSRSAKDLGCLRVRTAGEALLALRRSRRVREDCLLASTQHYVPTVFLREWRTIPVWSEFRGFMRNRQLVGWCSYHGKSGRATPPSQCSRAAIENALRRFFGCFALVSHLDDTVFDVYLHEDDPLKGMAATLIEINPFAPCTDGVYFSWAIPGDFDGTLRLEEKPRLSDLIGG